ncbi:MAG: NERD domain-containing protein, partial [Chloroflexi bacterium]|nr:NERD domain-containing protein [Chloroflexota bacterium]
MPVKLYVDQDSKGRPSPPHHTHEVNPVLEILNNIWKTFHPDQRTFVAISSLRDPSADLIVLAEVGIGIIELKHCEGVIHRKGSHWYADNRKIKAGSDTLGRKNPHEQVQEYALELRNKLLPSASGKGWLPGSRAEQEKCQFHTAVCFTDTQARLRLIKSDIQINGIETLPWE